MEFVQRNCSVYDCLLEKVNPTVIQSLSETKITGEWLRSEINKYKFDLVKVGIKVITNNHLSNLNTFSRLHSILMATKSHLSTILLMLIQQRHFHFFY